MTVTFIPTAKEAIALQLYRQGRSMAQIEANTTLTGEQIIAAVDRDARARFGYPGKPLPPPGGRRRGPAKPVDPDAVRAQAVRDLTDLVEGLREQLALREAELAELTGPAPSAPATDDHRLLAEARAEVQQT